MRPTTRTVALSIATAIAVLAALLLALAPGVQAAPVGLDALIGGNSIQCDGLEFSQFSYLPNNPPLAKPADIEVDCTTVGDMIGLAFTDAWASTAGKGQVLIDQLGFVVTGVNGERIVAASLVADPSVAQPDDSVSISETLFGLVDGCPA